MTPSVDDYRSEQRFTPSYREPKARIIDLSATPFFRDQRLVLADPNHMIGDVIPPMPGGPRMDDEYKIINSPLSQRITRDGTTIDVLIYRGERESAWILEVVDHAGGSTVWEETFQTEQAALNEVLRTVDEEGIACFLLDPIEKLH